MSSKLTAAVIDANEVASKAWRGVTASVVGQWLKWECERAGVERVEPTAADVVFVAYAGALGWRKAIKRALTAAGIPASHRQRNPGAGPVVIGGGDVAAIPLVGLEAADAICAGEGVRFVRDLFASVSRRADLMPYLDGCPNVITRPKIPPMDPVEPHLYAHEPHAQVIPDWTVDWELPAFESSDRVVRVIASKGCHKKCAFCATTYRQPYSVAPDGQRVHNTLNAAAKAGKRVQFVSNDPANIPWFTAMTEHISSGSFTIDEMRRPDVFEAIVKIRPKIVRMGVEGVSERIRQAFGKPIPTDEMVDIVGRLAAARVNWHLFIIAGAPYETDEDWAEFQAAIRRIRKAVNWGLHRIKITAFEPAPPAPLAIFRPSDYQPRYDAFYDWMCNNCLSRRILYVGPHRTPEYAVACAEAIGVPSLIKVAQEAARKCRTTPAAVRAVMPECLAADEATYRRLPWELVKWPLSPAQRLKVAEVYRKRMTDGVPTRHGYAERKSNVSTAERVTA